MKDNETKYEDLLKNALSQPEPYEEGAWENFRSKRFVVLRERRKRRVMLFGYSSGVAAAVFAFLLWILPGNNDEPLVAAKYNGRPELTSALYTPSITGLLPEIRSIRSLRNIIRSDKVETNDVKVLLEREHLPLPDLAGIQYFSDLSMPETASGSEKSGIIMGEENDNDNSQTKVREIRGIEFVRNSEIMRDLGTKRRSGDQNNRRLHFGVNFSPGFSATGGSGEPAMSFSGGVNMDVKIAGSISLSTGVQFERNSVESVTHSTEGVMPSTHTSATISNIDIPLNITWNILNNRSGSYYVSGGVSTLAYLGEEYNTTSYRQEVRSATIAMDEGAGATTYSVQNVETVNTTSVPPYSGVDFAGRVNLMFGYSYRLTPRLRMHVEPYVKIPLSGLASKEIRYTTGGVTFKVSF